MANKKNQRKNTGRGRKPVKQHKSKQANKRVFVNPAIPWKSGVVSASNNNQSKRISGTDFVQLGGKSLFTVPKSIAEDRADPVSSSGDVVLKMRVTPSLFERFELEMKTFQRYHIRSLRFDVLLTGGTQCDGMVAAAFFTDADDLANINSGTALLSRIAANGNNYQGNWYRPFSVNVSVTNPTGGFYGTETGETRLYSPGVFVMAVLAPPSTPVSFLVKAHWDVVFSQPTVEDTATAFTVVLSDDLVTLQAGGSVRGAAIGSLPAPVKSGAYVLDLGRYVWVDYLAGTVHHCVPVRYVKVSDDGTKLIPLVWALGGWSEPTAIQFNHTSNTLLAPTGSRLRMIDASAIPPLGDDWSYSPNESAVRYLTKAFLENFQV